MGSLIQDRPKATIQSNQDVDACGYQHLGSTNFYCKTNSSDKVLAGLNIQGFENNHSIWIYYSTTRPSHLIKSV